MEKLLLSSAAPVSLPVIDLSGSRDEVRRAVLRAGKEFGCFQVINHGMPEETMREIEASCRDFFRLPPADYSEDAEQTNRLFSESDTRACLRLACHPVERTMPRCPEKPMGLRPALENFIIPARSIGMELLRLLAEGIGLRADYFEGDLTGGDMVIDANRYPPCPDPSLNLGLQPHRDRILIGVLLQPGYVCGLQASYHRRWIDVEPIPGALVINFGHQMEIATNGLLPSMEYRVVANGAIAKTSVAAFIMPTSGCVVEPARELVGKGSPARYRSVAFRGFVNRRRALGESRQGLYDLNI